MGFGLAVFRVPTSVEYYLRGTTRLKSVLYTPLVQEARFALHLLVKVVNWFVELAKEGKYSYAIYQFSFVSIFHRDGRVDSV